MTVKELIAALQHFPPEMEAVIESTDTRRRAMAIRSAALDLMDKASRDLYAGTKANSDDYENVVGIYWSWHPDDADSH